MPVGCVGCAALGVIGCVGCIVTGCVTSALILLIQAANHAAALRLPTMLATHGLSVPCVNEIVISFSLD